MLGASATGRSCTGSRVKWSWGQSGVRAWAGLEVGVGLNEAKVDMHGVTNRNSLNWLFDIS